MTFLTFSHYLSLLPIVLGWSSRQCLASSQNWSANTDAIISRSP